MSEPVRLEHQERVRDFYRNQGKATEQQRIIKLLEESACCQDECSFHEELTNIIALIKGETNE